MEDRICPDDEVRVAPETCGLRGAVGMHLEDVPHVLVGALKRAEADGDAEKALSAPQGARGDEHLPDLKKINIAGIHNI